MGRRHYGPCVVIAFASALAACAATPPAKPVEKTAASNSAPASAVAPKKATNLTAGYRQVTKNGVEYYCKREGVTGSRLEAHDTCLTLAQLEAQRANSEELLRRLNSVPAEMPGVDSGGGTSNSAMTH
jgi:hypothetical protein